MTDLTLESLRAELAPFRAELATLREGLTAVREEMTVWRPYVTGVPLIGAAIESLRHDVRTLRAAINDMARVTIGLEARRNITAGEVEALHADLDRLQTKQMELEARLAVVEARP